MARLTFVVLALLTVAVPCLAGVGEMGIYADPQGSNCFLYDNGGSALITTYVVHHFYSGDQAIGSRFGIELSAGASWLFLGFQSAFQGIPSTLSDIALGYGSCINTTTMVGYALWLSPVATPTCTTLTLKPADSLPTIIFTDCAYNELPPPFVNFMVANPNGSCWCFTATQPTTWGSVKALYR